MHNTDALRVDAHLWNVGVTALQREWASLPIEEKNWIRKRLEAIEILQQRLHQLFLNGNGVAHCRRCAGECCARGKYHVTLVNLLFFVTRDRTPPSPDFSSTCPMLAPEGCRLAPGERPFNCVTFVCDPVEETMGPAACTTFYATERTLRRLYDEFEQRYAGAGMRGFLLAQARVGDDSPLRRLDIHPAAAGI